MQNTINSQHYDKITKPWQSILGDNFHWGYYMTQTDSLETATINLINKMASYGNFNETIKVLDIGCGIGTPARYLNRKYGCKVVGISNSHEGVNEANENALKNNVEKDVKFFLRDALDNQFTNNIFDIAWLMEMSHLIEEKEKLVQESFRVIKSKGNILLCDLTLKIPLQAREIFRMSQQLRCLENSFGKANLLTLFQYKNIFESVGFTNVQLIDISQEVIPTLQHWKENLFKNKESILKDFSVESYEGFIESCDILKNLYVNERWGYGIVVGEKP